MDSKSKSIVELIVQYGGIDDRHHKNWLLDQVVRIATDCPLVVKSAKDCNGTPYEYEALGESPE